MLCGRDWAAGVEGRGSGRRRSDVIRPDEDAMKDEVWFIVGYAGRRDVGDEDGGRGNISKMRRSKKSRRGREEGWEGRTMEKSWGCPSVQVSRFRCPAVKASEGGRGLWCLVGADTARDRMQSPTRWADQRQRRIDWKNLVLACSTVIRRPRHERPVSVATDRSNSYCTS